MSKKEQPTRYGNSRAMSITVVDNYFQFLL